MDSDAKINQQQVALALDIFDKLCGANSLKSILGHSRHLLSVLKIKPTNFADFSPKLKEKLSSWDAKDVLGKFEKRAGCKFYERGKAAYGSKVLIIGAGPCGLRTAIEMQLLGARVVLLEKRASFSRNNVLHLWPFVITDLKALGAKRFYGKFCAGSIDHISITQMQCMLMKMAVLVGVEIYEGVSFEKLCEPAHGVGWRILTDPVDHPVTKFEFDVLIGADGRRNTLEGFKRKALRAKLAIAITANFVNKRTEAEAKVQEISGVSFIFKQAFFQELCEETGIDLENIVYYKDETHYFVMTAKKHSLLWKGVLKEDNADTDKLLLPENVDLIALQNYALEAANYSTEGKLPNLEFAVNYRGNPDVAIVDFTAMYQSENACRVVQRQGHKLLVGLVGDSLLEPFWPTGSGCARGFLSSLDAAWMVRSWAKGRNSVLETLAEREAIYRLLAQTTHENLNKDHNGYTADPSTRYPNLNPWVVKPFQVKSLYDTDDEKNEEIVNIEPVIQRRRSSVQMAHTLKRQLSEDSMIELLLSWLRRQISNYGVDVTGIHGVFVNGDALCAILHHFRKDLIPEYPLPSDVQEGIDPFDAAAFRNQLAFDFLHDEYGLPYVVSGFDSVQYVSSHLPKLIDYLTQVYELFKDEGNPSYCLNFEKQLPNMEAKTSEKNFAAETQSDDSDFEYEYQSDEDEGNANRSSGYPLMHTNTLPAYLFQQRAEGSKVKKSVKLTRRPSRIEKLIKRLETSGGDSEKDPKSSATAKENSEECCHGHVNRKRLEEAEKSKLEALQLIQLFQTRQAEKQKEAQAEQREKVVRSIRRLQLSQGEDDTLPSHFSTMSSDDFFNEYNMRLYRQSVPSIEQRGQQLTTRFTTAGQADDLEFKECFGNVGKLNREDDSALQALERKIAESATTVSSSNAVSELERVPLWSKDAFQNKLEALSKKAGYEKRSNGPPLLKRSTTFHVSNTISSKSEFLKPKSSKPFRDNQTVEPESTTIKSVIQSHNLGPKINTKSLSAVMSHFGVKAPEAVEKVAAVISSSSNPKTPKSTKPANEYSNSLSSVPTTSKDVAQAPKSTSSFTPAFARSAKSKKQPAFLEVPKRAQHPDSDIDEELITNLNEAEMEHLMDWADKNF